MPEYGMKTALHVKHKYLGCRVIAIAIATVTVRNKTKQNKTKQNKNNI